MNLNKFIQKWRTLMAKALAGIGIKPRRELPRVELIPVSMAPEEGKQKFEETQRLLAQIVTLSHKRGRRKKDHDQEDTHAA